MRERGEKRGEREREEGERLLLKEDNEVDHVWMVDTMHEEAEVNLVKEK